jgi:hypothetical protein
MKSMFTFNNIFMVLLMFSVINVFIYFPVWSVFIYKLGIIPHKKYNYNTIRN